MYHKFFMNSRQCCIFTCIMKKLLFYIPVLALLMACSHQRYPSVLLTADSLCSTIPDSAVTLLNSLELEMKQADKATRTYYQLLSIKAADKAYITHTSDSLIQEVLQYYIRRDDHRHLPEAWYYAGRVCRDLGDAPQALDYFQKAIETLPAEGEYELKSRIYSQMGTLFLYQDVYDEAMKANKESLKYSYYLNDTIGVIYSLRDIGEIFTAYNLADSALHYYHLAHQLSASVGEQDIQGVVLRAQASLYLQLGETEKARNTLLNSLSGLTNISEASVLSLSAKCHQQEGNLDSAAYYYQELLKKGNIYNHYDAHKGLAYIAEQNGNTQSALYHIYKCQQCNDSITERTNSENIKRMQSLYNYQLREKENQQLKAITHQQREWLLIAVLLTFVLISFFIIYYIQGRYKHMQTLHRLRELEIIKEQQYRYSISRLEENKNKIAELEKQLEILNSREGINNEQLQTQKEQIEIENRKIELEFNKKEKAIKSLKESDIYRKFHQADSVSDLTKEDWEILQQAINNTYENFTNHLYALFPISNTELKICLLLKIGMPVSKIAILIGRTKSTVTSARKKLYEKMFNKKGTPDMFDKIIDDL